MTPEERRLLFELAAKAGVDLNASADSENPGDSAEEPEQEGKKSVASQVVDAAITEGAVLFRCDDEAYIHIPAGESLETAPVGSSRTKQWLRSLWYRRRKSALPSQSVADAVATLEARALIEGQEKPVYLRVAPGPSGSIYLDLANDRWEAVHITAAGWKVVSNHGVAFLRPKGMKALPTPKPGGSAWELFDFVSVGNDRMTGLTDKTVILSFVLGAMLPDCNYNHIELMGEAGSGKTTAAKVLKKAVDPSAVETQGPPSDGKALFIGARTEHLQIFDNLSRISSELSDDLCRLSTGGGKKERKLYTDGDQSVLQARRPVIFTSINPVIRENDLAQRTLSVTTSPIEEYQTESDFWRRFEQRLPYILGGLLTLLAGGLRELPNVETRPDLPRIADWGRFMIAVERAAGWEDGMFLDCYYRNYRATIEAAIEADPVASALLRIAKEEKELTVTAEDLLSKVIEKSPEKVVKDRYFPKDSVAIGKRITKFLGFLRQVGVVIVRHRSATIRTMTITYHDKESENNLSDPSSCHSESETSVGERLAAKGWAKRINGAELVERVHDAQLREVEAYSEVEPNHEDIIEDALFTYEGGEQK